MEKKTRQPKLRANQLSSIKQGLELVAFSLIVILGLRYVARDLVAPLLLAIFFSALISPLFFWFRKRGLSAALSLLLMVLTVVISLVGLAIFFTWAFNILRDYLSEFVTNLRASATEMAAALGFDVGSVNEIAGAITPETIVNLLGTILGSFDGLLTYLFIVPFLAILIMLQVDSIPAKTKEGLLKQSPFLQKISKFTRAVTVYVVGRFKVNLFTGTLITFVLLLLGIPFAFLWGVVTVILSFVPWIGLFIAGIPPTLIAFSQSGLIGAGLVILSIVVINLVAENILEPFVQGRGNKISAAALIVSFIFWTWLFGPIGAILTAPLTVLLKVIFADYSETAWIASLMEGNYNQAKVSKSTISKVGGFFKELLPGNGKKSK